MTLAVNIAQSGSNNVTFRNRIINGAMVVNQRATTLTDYGYATDRWSYNPTSASKASVAQSSTAPAGFVNSLLTTSTAATTVGTNDIYIVEQKIEGYNIADLGWGTANAKTVTLSFWAYSSLTGTFGGALANAGPDRSYPFNYTVNAANTWEYKTITVAGDTSGTWNSTNGAGIRVIFSVGSGATRSGTANAWTGTSNIVQPTGSLSLLATNGATLYLTGVQLEAGTTASPFEYRQYGTELLLCQRYYEKTYSQGVVPGTSTESNVEWAGTSFQSLASTGTFQAQLRPFKVIKRAAPTMTFWDMVGNQGKWTRYLVGGGPNNNNTVTVDSQDDCGFRMFVAGTSSTSNATGHWTASSEL